MAKYERGPDPKVEIPKLQKLVEEAWMSNTFVKTRAPGEVSFTFTINRDALAPDKKDLFGIALDTEF